MNMKMLQQRMKRNEENFKDLVKELETNGTVSIWPLEKL